MTVFAGEALAQAVEAVRHGEPLVLALQRLTGEGPDRVLAGLAGISQIPCMTLEQLESLSPDFGTLDYGECLQRQCILLSDPDGRRFFVNSNPLDQVQHTWASYAIKGEFALAFTHPSELRALFSRLEAHQEAISQVIGAEQAASWALDIEEISLESIAQDESLVVRLVNSTVYDAHKTGASDIHFENTMEGLVIKYRIDGVLTTMRQLPNPVLTEQVISRIKVMAELDIGEKRIPQDGRFSASIASREIDFRVSIMPGLFGEDAVLRILDKQSLTSELTRLDLSVLGFDPDTRSAIRRLAAHPYGMLLVTGPTGSGKTTSLYATLSELNHGDDKVITIEDPVEYQLPGVLQIPVNEKKGLTFARGLRSILRHDPDRILVGEIRDRETAEIAVQAALTGHLVYTTVHANNVFDVVSRFRHMQVDMYSFVTALNGVVAQRLIRMICEHCATPCEPPLDLLRASGIDQVLSGNTTFRFGKGCAHCRGTGYKGRRALAEILVFTDELRELILGEAPLTSLKAKAYEQGMCSMRDAAVQMAVTGQTTLEEVNRVTFAG